MANFIQFGDIIKITAPTELLLDEQTFYINYIDEEHAKCINIETSNTYILKFDENHDLVDKSIEKIEIINRAETPSYAKQNSLVPGTWVDVYFGGVTPFVLTGEITQLVEDMIEVTTYPSERVFNIDFEYKGLPETIKLEYDGQPTLFFIQKIDIRNSPIESSKSLDTVHDVDQQIEQAIISADQIQYTSDSDATIEYEQVPESEFRYSIESQTSDLLDSLLSNVPTYERNDRIINKIHTDIERFKQLRYIFLIMMKMVI